MSMNIHQVFVANPITSNASTDLIYVGQSPYGAGNDAAITYANFAAQFGAPYTAAALTEVNDTNVTLSLGGTPATALLHAVSITAGWTGQLSLARGGTNANLTASNGSVAYSSASAIALSAVGTSGQLFQSAGAGAPGWTTSTYPATNAINTLLYASSANTMAALATVNNASLSTNATGVPTWLALTDGQIVIGSSAGAPLAGTITAGTNISVTNGHNSITIANTAAAGFTSVNQNTSSATLAANSRYATNNGASLVTYTIPAGAAVGDTYMIVGGSSGGWTVAQPASVTCHLGTSTTTTGVGGSLSSSNQYDCLTLTCVASNTFTVYGVQGNITVV